ncbi:MAG: hypothetical protein ACMX3H_19610 [Sodalis sp. (in: enterobacteria)]|uniref:hypothetical protein n=1 Tax=Sodalis sp. (in: enterobacteria) TaxID=1898979 RepID=UPI0039E2C151
MLNIPPYRRAPFAALPRTICADTVSIRRCCATNVQAFRPISGNGRQVVLAFAGTNGFNDWLTNLRASLGYRDAQYQASVALARQARHCFGDKVLFTGHSLGGSLAAIAAVATGSMAVTFNPADVAEKTLSRYGASPARAKRRAASGSICCYSGQYESAALRAALVAAATRGARASDYALAAGASCRQRSAVAGISLFLAGPRHQGRYRGNGPRD